MEQQIEQLVRQNIKMLKPYASARTEFIGQAKILLDANENPIETGLNRYPDPLQKDLKQRISSIKGVPSSQLFLGNGSDEVIDLLFRIFCVPAVDQVITLPPTYGMYQVSADIADVQVVEVILSDALQPRVAEILSRVTPQTKMLFICHPNNPTGNLMDENIMVKLLDQFPGVVIIDEAYIDFCPEASMVKYLKKYPRLVVMQTLSKAWGLAGIRLGIALAHPDIIALLNKVKPPYNINVLTQQTALNVLTDSAGMRQHVQYLIEQRTILDKALQQLSYVTHVFPSATNFLLARVHQPMELYQYLTERGIIVRNRSKVILCEGSLRFTVGMATENQALIEALKQFEL